MSHVCPAISLAALVASLSYHLAGFSLQLQLHEHEANFLSTMQLKYIKSKIYLFIQTINL